MRKTAVIRCFDRDMEMNIVFVKVYDLYMVVNVNHLLYNHVGQMSHFHHLNTISFLMIQKEAAGYSNY